MIEVIEVARFDESIWMKIPVERGAKNDVIPVGNNY